MVDVAPATHDDVVTEGEDEAVRRRDGPALLRAVAGDLRAGEGALLGVLVCEPVVLGPVAATKKSHGPTLARHAGARGGASGA